MTLETWIIKGGVVDSTQAANGTDEPVNMGIANLIASLAEIGFTGTSTLTNSGTPGYITVTNQTSKLADMEKLLQVVKAAGAGIVYTKGS